MDKMRKTCKTEKCRYTVTRTDGIKYFELFFANSTIIIIFALLSFV